MISKPYVMEEPDSFKETWIESYQSDENGSYVILKSSPFYPQGGGQPSDQGYLVLEEEKLFILRVKEIEGQVQHYIAQARKEDLVGKKVECKVDLEKRELHSKLHTSAIF